MLKEAIEFVFGLGDKAHPVVLSQIEGRQYASRAPVEVKPPELMIPKVGTLGGLCDLVKAGVAGIQSADVYVHIFDHETVVILSRQNDAWGRRIRRALAELQQKNAFAFGQFLDHEAFFIGLHSQFVENEDQKYLLRLAANLTAERVTTSEETGITQVAGQRRGVVLKSSEEVRPRVSLAPFRTFREIEQPASDFILRLKQDGDNIPKLALFEADGGAWRIRAIENIARFLSTALDDIPVVS